MVKGKIDLLKEKIGNDPYAYYRMRAKYHEGLLANLNFQKLDSVNDPKLDKSIKRVERKLRYYIDQMTKIENENSKRD
jgi:hypothetical protein